MIHRASAVLCSSVLIFLAASASAQSPRRSLEDIRREAETRRRQQETARQERESAALQEADRALLHEINHATAEGIERLRSQSREILEGAVNPLTDEQKAILAAAGAEMGRVLRKARFDAEGRTANNIYASDHSRRIAYDAGGLIDAAEDVLRKIASHRNNENLKTFLEGRLQVLERALGNSTDGRAIPYSGEAYQAVSLLREEADNVRRVVGELVSTQGALVRGIVGDECLYVAGITDEATASCRRDRESDTAEWRHERERSQGFTPEILQTIINEYAPGPAMDSPYYDSPRGEPLVDAFNEVFRETGYYSRRSPLLASTVGGLSDDTLQSLRQRVAHMVHWLPYAVVRRMHRIMETLRMAGLDDVFTAALIRGGANLGAPAFTESLDPVFAGESRTIDPERVVRAYTGYWFTVGSEYYDNTFERFFRIDAHRATAMQLHHYEMGLLETQDASSYSFRSAARYTQQAIQAMVTKYFSLNNEARYYTGNPVTVCRHRIADAGDRGLSRHVHGVTGRVAVVRAIHGCASYDLSGSNSVHEVRGGRSGIEAFWSGDAALGRERSEFRRVENNIDDLLSSG